MDLMCRIYKMNGIYHEGVRSSGSCETALGGKKVLLNSKYLTLPIIGIPQRTSGQGVSFSSSSDLDLLRSNACVPCVC